MMDVLKKFLTDESGVTAIEDGLIAAGISLSIISVVNGLGASSGKSLPRAWCGVGSGFPSRQARSVCAEMMRK